MVRRAGVRAGYKGNRRTCSRSCCDSRCRLGEGADRALISLPVVSASAGRGAWGGTVGGLTAEAGTFGEAVENSDLDLAAVAASRD